MEIKRPLAYRARPKNLADVVGQDHILGKNGVITKMIVWSPRCWENNNS